MDEGTLCCANLSWEVMLDLKISTGNSYFLPGLKHCNNVSNSIFRVMYPYLTKLYKMRLISVIYLMFKYSYSVFYLSIYSFIHWFNPRSSHT